MTDSSFAGLLGGAFVADSGKDNQGYPIFSWQKGSSVSNPDSPSVAPVEEEKPEQQTTVSKQTSKYRENLRRLTSATTACPQR